MKSRVGVSLSVSPPPLPLEQPGGWIPKEPQLCWGREGGGLLLWLGLGCHNYHPRGVTSRCLWHGLRLRCSARSAFPASLWKPLGSGTLTDHDARECQDEGGHECRGHDGEDQREWQVGLWGG